jgi:hypothetical protein
LKIKIFLWQLSYDALLTRDNLKKRNWNGSPFIRFVTIVKMQIIFFFSCAIARVTWGCIGVFVGATSCPSNRVGRLWLGYIPICQEIRSSLLC